MKYKKSELTRFAKDIAYANKILIDGICMSEEVIYSDIGKTLVKRFDDENQELIFELAKRFSKYTNDQMSADTETHARTLNDISKILNDIVACCEENNWFEEKK